MDQRDIFTTLSRYPFSYSSLEKLNKASLSLRRRYPGLKCSGPVMLGIDVQASHDDHLFSVPSHWQAYKNSIWDMEFGDYGDSILVLLGDKDNLLLNETVVDRYLRLLRTEFQEAEIRDIQTTGNIDIMDDKDPERISIIPVHTKGNWAFAVVYWDCIHWFDSAPGAPVPQFSPRNSQNTETIWTGPKYSRPADSGIFMLLGIRLILSGKPHLEKIPQTLVNDFRCLMLIELLCNKIDPSEEDFKSLPQAKDPQSSDNGMVDENIETHFDNAILSSQLEDPTISESSQNHLGNSTFDANVVSASSTFGMRAPGSTAPYLVETDTGEAESTVPFWRAHHQEQEAYGDPASIPQSTNLPEAQQINSPLVASSTGQSPLEDVHAVSEEPLFFEEQAERSPQRRSNESLTRSSIVQSRQPSKRRRIQKDDRVVILELLSEAFVVCRSRKDPCPTDLFLLWSLIEKGAVTSTFFRRYYSVCFWEQTKNIQDRDLTQSLSNQGISRKIKDRMANCRKECKRWWDLCHLWCPNDPQNPKKYTVCAIPLGDKARLDKDAYDRLKERLESAGDDLSSYLTKAEELCLLLTQNVVPEHLLMIDNFVYKTNIDVESDFETYLSCVPQPKMSLTICSSD